MFRSRLDQIIDLYHALVKLSRAIDWRFLEERFGSVDADGPGSPPLPTRLMAGLAILKHMHDLSDEEVHNAPSDHKFKVYTAGQKRRVTPQIKCAMKRRSAVEPVIGHLKAEHVLLSLARRKGYWCSRFARRPTERSGAKTTRSWKRAQTLDTETATGVLLMRDLPP